MTKLQLMNVQKTVRRGWTTKELWGTGL